MKKATRKPIPATALFDAKPAQWAPPPELLPELDEVLRRNAAIASTNHRVGPRRLSVWFSTEHAIKVGPEMLRSWMQRRSQELGLK